MRRRASWTIGGMVRWKPQGVLNAKREHWTGQLYDDRRLLPRGDAPMGAGRRFDEHRVVTAAASPPTPPAPFERLLLTGAAGGLGRELRPRLAGSRASLRLSDVAPMDAAGAGEEVVVAALQDAAAVDRIVAGAQAVVHLGGISAEGPFEPILAGQHRRRLEPLRSGAPARRQAHRVRELEPRHRLLSPGRSHRAARSDAPRRPLRPQQGVRREPRRASTSTATASRPCACASARRSPSRRTAACSRPGSATTTSSAWSSRA